MRLVLFLVLLPFCLSAQHVPVLEGLNGIELLTQIRAQFRPASTLGYNNARDTLFRNILAVNNQLSCLYTDYTITLDPGSDPSENAFSQGINTEHIFPQSKGAEDEPMRSNMYNLYPTRENVNSDRANDPFGEVPDNTTQWWYYKAIKQSNKPTTNIDRYSEHANNVFEPQENRKGDIARSVMYFYSVYTPEADAADPNYFQSMITDICKWHFDDPVDEAEWNRNILIATYQNDKANPFILDCTVPERSYCSNNGMQCNPQSSTKDITYPIKPLEIYPSVLLRSVHEIHVKTPPSLETIIIMDASGRQLVNTKTNNAVKQTIEWKNSMPGSYVVFGIDKFGYIIATGRFIVL